MPGSTCTRCGAPIRFILLESGKHIAVNAIADPEGNYCAFRVPVGVDGVEYVRGYQITPARRAHPDGFLFLVHQAICRTARLVPPPRDLRDRIAAARAEALQAQEGTTTQPRETPHA